MPEKKTRERAQKDAREGKLRPRKPENSFVKRSNTSARVSTEFVLQSRPSQSACPRQGGLG
jgi:hypothetical protein